MVCRAFANVGVLELSAQDIFVDNAATPNPSPNNTISKLFTFHLALSKS
jgi:hypothetical protein